MVDILSLEVALSLFPEVSWDRYTRDVDDTMMFYGWIDRDDSYKDFLILEFDENQHVERFITSSAKYSEEFYTRLFGERKSHVPCQRVEDLLLDPKKVRYIKLRRSL